MIVIKIKNQAFINIKTNNRCNVKEKEPNDVLFVFNKEEYVTIAMR